MCFKNEHVNPSNFIQYLETVEEEYKITENKIIATLAQLTDTNDTESKIWMKNLFNNNQIQVGTSSDIEIGIAINTTVIDSITAKLLNINLGDLIKAKILKEYIITIWTDNGGETDIFHKKIISDNTSRDLYMEIKTSYLQQNETNTPVYNENNISSQNRPPMEIEIIKEELGEEEKEKIQYQLLRDQVITSDNITQIRFYNTRNRKPDNTNPFFINSKGTYKAGIMKA